jgi:hypothetical protein
MVQEIYGQKAKKLTGEIYDGICIRQSFEAKADRLVSVEIYFATYKRSNPGQIHVDVLDFRRSVVASAKIESEMLKDNSYREFGLGVELIPGRPYELKVYTKNCRCGKSPTSMWGKKTSEGSLFVGRSLIRDGELTAKFNYEGNAEDSTPLSVAVDHHSSLLKGAIGGLVSVVVPFYNCHELLPKCLASIARQTYSCLEVIVVDDGSKRPSETKKIIQSFQHLIPALSLKRLDKNEGAPHARNTGAELASGEYLFFCDSDVELYPEAIETLVRSLLGAPRADFAYGGFLWGTERVPPKPFDVERLRKRNYITTMSLLRRVVFPKWDERLKRHQDWDLWLTMVNNGSRGICCGKYLFETPVRVGSISTEENIGMMESIGIVKEKHGL